MKLKSNNNFVRVKQIIAVFIVSLLVVSGVGYATIIHNSGGGRYDTAYNNQYLTKSDIDYLIFTDGTNYYALNGSTREFVTSNTNFTTVLQTCIDYGSNIADVFSNNAGNHIHIKTGTYTVTGGIDIKGSLWISGDGLYQTCLTLDDSVGFHMFNYVGTSNETFFTLTDIYLYGNKANNNGNSNEALHVEDNGGKFWDVKIERVFINNFDGNGIYTEEVWGWYVSDTVIEFCDGYGWKSVGGQRGTVYACKILDNENGVQLDGSDRMMWDMVQIGGNQKHGLYIGAVGKNADENVFTSCQIIGNNAADTGWATGITIDGSSKNNQFLGCLHKGSGLEKYGFDIKSTVVNTTIDNYHTDDDYKTSFINNNGQRTVINGMGNNTGNPNSAGEWQNLGRFGIQVIDDNSDTIYICNVTTGTTWAALN